MMSQTKAFWIVIFVALASHSVGYYTGMQKQRVECLEMMLQQQKGK